MVWRRRGLAVVALVLVLAGCSGSDGDKGSLLDGVKGTGTAPATAAAATRTATATAAQTAGAFEELLALVPDTEQTRQQVYLSNIDRFRRAYNIQPPANPADEQQKTAYLEAISAAALQKGAKGGTGGFASGHERPPASLVTIERYLGYRRVDQDILAGGPPEQYEAVRGLFDPAAAERAITGCAADTCPIPARRSQVEGVVYYRWGEDFHQELRSRFMPPVLDQLGRGGRIAVTEQYVLRTLWTAGMEQMLKVWKGNTGSLRQAEDVRLAARSMDRLAAHYAFLTSETQGADVAKAEIELAPAAGRAAVEAAWSTAAGKPVLERYQYVAAGWSVEGGTTITVIVLVHATEQAAQQNAAHLTRRIAESSSAKTGKPWKDQITGVESKVEGRVLEVKLKGATFGPEFLYNRDPLLLHR